MENRKEYCKKLARRWEQLERETKFEAQEVSKITGETLGRINRLKKSISEKLRERDKIKEELETECKDFYSEKQ